VTIQHAIERIQFCYPQVYYACHTRHDRARSTPAHLSARDSEILVHLDRRTPLTLTELARHMDLSRSTLSEALSRLTEYAYVTKAPRDSRDRRHIGIVLTKKGVDAVRASSVLESRRLQQALSNLTAGDLGTVVAGLELLARASRDAAQSERVA
jgi:DNA-binding MarR family transcriptional regulator